MTGTVGVVLPPPLGAEGVAPVEGCEPPVDGDTVLGGVDVEPPLMNAGLLVTPPAVGPASVGETSVVPAPWESSANV
ncbi:MAG TPA: hypothetical protein VM491_13000 [Burkholderiaceae bacterium]|nr:hypothetical protein [Burkholderiaceae bacterium]